MPIQSKIVDAITLHAVELTQIEASLNTMAVNQLKSLEGELAGALAKADPTGTAVTTFKTARLRALLKQTQAQIAKTYTAIQAGVEAELVGVAGLTSHTVLDAINGAIGVDIATVGLSTAEVASIMKEPFIQGAASTDWWLKQSTQLQEKYANEIRKGMLAGEPLGSLLQRIRGTQANGFKDGVMATSTRNAKALIRSSVQGIANRAKELSYQGNADIIKEVLWHSALDNRTTPACQLRSGKRYKLDHTPIGHSIPWGAGPGSLHWQCRSTSVPVTKSWAELAGKPLKKGKTVEDTFKANLKAKGMSDEQIAHAVKGMQASDTGLVAKELDYEGWLKTKSPDFQDSVLGKKKAAMWREGKVGFTDLVDGSGNPKTVAQILNEKGWKPGGGSPVSAPLPAPEHLTFTESSIQGGKLLESEAGSIKYGYTAGTGTDAAKFQIYDIQIGAELDEQQFKAYTKAMMEQAVKDIEADPLIKNAIFHPVHDVQAGVAQELGFFNPEDGGFFEKAVFSPAQKEAIKAAHDAAKADINPLPEFGKLVKEAKDYKVYKTADNAYVFQTNKCAIKLEESATQANKYKLLEVHAPSKGYTVQVVKKMLDYSKKEGFNSILWKPLGKMQLQLASEMGFVEVSGPPNYVWELKTANWGNKTLKSLLTGSPKKAVEAINGAIGATGKGITEFKAATGAKVTSSIEDARQLMARYKNSITVEMDRAFRRYSGSDYQYMNGYLKGTRPDVENHIKENINLLSKGLAEAPKVATTSYRGHRFRSKGEFNAFMNQCKSNGIVTFKEFLSTSVRKDTALSFAAGTEDSLIFEVKGRNGVWYDGLSNYSSEQEVIFNHGTSFRYLGERTDKLGLHNRKVVILEEI